MKNLIAIFLMVTSSVQAARASAADWPMWRYNPARSGATAEELADELYPQWTLHLGPVGPAFPNEPRLWFDAGYEPVVIGERFVVGSSIDGSITTYDVKTGGMLWRFFTEGPVRFAPVLASDRVFAGSDDGYLYCLSLAEGSLLWKVRGAPEDRPQRRHLGNNRLISYWPIRGGPVLAGGTIYCAAGIWPTLGVFIVAVDPQSGEVRWRNGKLASIDDVRLDHNALGTSGLAPQGYLVVQGNTLLVPNGRSMPAGLDRRTGDLLYYVQGYRNGDCRVTAGERIALVGESGVIDLQTGREVGSRWAAAGADAPKAFDSAKFHLFEGPIHPYKMFPGCNWRSALADGTAYGLDSGVFYAYNLQAAGVSEYETKSGDRVLKPWRWDAPLEWKLDTSRSGRQAAPLVKAGKRLYGHTGQNLIAVTLPGDGKPARISWRAAFDSEPTSLVAASGRLFVATKTGELHCFGPQKAEAVAAAAQKTQAVASSEEAASTVAAAINATKVREGYGILFGVGDGAVLREFLRQSNMKAVGIDADRDVIDKRRAELAGEGLYGARAELFVGDPAAFHLPPYLVNLILARDPRDLGFPDGSPSRVFESLRPYGGIACVALPADRQPAFEQWVAAAGLQQAQVRRAGDFAILERCGALAGSASWTHESADASRSYFSRDRLVKPPLGILWYGDGPDHGFWKHKDYGTGVKPQVVGGRLIAFQIDTNNLIACDVYTGRLLWRQPVDPFTRYASQEDGIFVAGGNRVRVLDPATGRERAAWPVEIEPGQTPFVSDIRVDGSVIVVGLAKQKVRVIEEGLWDSTTLAALDRTSGQTLWKRAASQRFNLHALAMGGGLVFAVDSRSPTETDRSRRQGEGPAAASQPSTVLAMDARTGELRWSAVVENPFRTYALGGWTAMRANDDWLAYSQPLGLLLTGKFNRAAAYDAPTGRLAWQAQVAAGQPWIVRGETAITQSGHVYDLRNGRPTGAAFNLSRGGCNYAVGNEAMILLRDRSVCYVETGTQQRHSLYAIRSGCSNSLVAADGVLSVPNFAVGCVCNYPIQTSFAMVHLPEALEP